MENTKVLEEEFAKFEDWYKAIIFDQNCNIIAKKNCDKLKDGELKEFLTVFNDRDTTIGKGFMFCGYHFDAHRFHPPLTYGRRGGPEGGPEEAEGICCARLDKDGTKYFMVITYVYPIVSARAISIIPDYLKATGCKSIIFDKNCNIIAKKNCDKLKDGELKEFLTVFDDRDTTIGKGFMFCGYHFDAHRFHPPLTYGRRGGPEGGPEDAEGICCARLDKDGEKYFMVITYVYPIVSARAISIIPDFLKATNCKYKFILYIILLF